MPGLDFVTSGESHGKGVLALLEGLPAGLDVSIEAIDAQLRMRQAGYGRGSRQAIEEDRCEVLGGLRSGRTLGSPLSLWISNKDRSLDNLEPVRRPRPGHGDLAGCLKIGCRDARDILERASARETAARVAAGAVAAQLLSRFSVRVFAHVISAGGVESHRRPLQDLDRSVLQQREKSPMRCLDPDASSRMVEAVDSAIADKDTVGGVVEVIAFGVLPGVGGYDRWESGLDVRLAAALMGIPSARGVEFGIGFPAAALRGSEMHDEIHYNPSMIADGRTHGFMRASNRAGGIEGGMSNGEQIVARVALKPVPTLGKPLKTVDILTGRGAEASSERSDVCAVASAAVVAENAAAFEIARAYREKFGGDSTTEMVRNFEGYVASLRGFIP